MKTNLISKNYREFRSIIDAKKLMQKFSFILVTLLMIMTGQGTSWASSEVIYYHHDALGSIVASTDQNGAILWQEEYQPYGEKVYELARTDDGIENKYWYTGKPYDGDLDLSYFGARWYDAKQGRFLSIDPAPVKAENIHSFNRYAYANNNPYRYVDPDGRLPVDHDKDDDGVIELEEYGSSYSGFLPFRLHDFQGYTMEAPNSWGGCGGLTIKVPKSLPAPKVRGSSPSPAVDPTTGTPVGRFVVDSKGNTMIEPVGGSTVGAGRTLPGGVRQDTHTTYPNGSTFQRLNASGHGNNPTPHGHGHGVGTGPGMRGQGPSLDINGNVVPNNSPAAHWPAN